MGNEEERRHRCRVRRRGAVTLPLVGLAILSVGYALAGGQGIAETAAAALTPGERIERVKAAHRDYGLHGGREREAVTVNGVVVTDDGRPLPDDAKLAILSWSSPLGGRTYTPSIEQGQFSVALPAGTIRVLIEARAYAPAFAGPLKVEPRQQPVDVKLRLSPGFRATVRLMEPEDVPVAAAEVTISYPVGDLPLGHEDLRTDSDGLLRLEHVADAPMRLVVTADGYQAEQRDHHFRPGEVLEWRLSPARPTRGLVTSRATGKPIAGAEICIIHGPLRRYGQPLGVPATAVSDEHGRFTLKSLQEDAVYDLIVRAPEHAPAFVHEVRAGQTDLRVDLGPELYVRGQVLGPLDALTQWEGGPAVGFWRERQTSAGEVRSHEYAPVEVRDGVGYFEVADLWEGPLEILAGYEGKTLRVKEPVEDLVIDLRGDEGVREVQICFVPPDGYPAPTGDVSIGYWRGWDASRGATYPLRNGQISFEAPVPSEFHVRPDLVLGYWFEDLVPVRVRNGEGPLPVTIPVAPAGAVVGQLFGSNGDALSWQSVAAVGRRMQEGIQDRFVMARGQTDDQGRFYLGPVPFGARCLVVASEGTSFAASDPVVIDEDGPVAEVSVELGEGETLRGRAVGPDGEPVDGAEVRLTYDTECYYSTRLCLKKGF